MSIGDKEVIETRFGPLWSGKTEVPFRGGVRTLRDVKRALDLAGEDVMSIDLHELPGGTVAFRYYDGDDRRIVVLVIDEEGGILEEFRAHIAEWLGELYYESGALAYDSEAMLHLLRKKSEAGGAPPGGGGPMLICRKTEVRESAAQWNLDALVGTPEGDILPCFVAVVSSYCTVQAPNTKDGEAIFGDVAGALGAPPSSPPQAVKGGSCGGEEEDGEFPFTGSMISATWEFPKERRGAVLSSIRRLFGMADGLSG